MHPELVRSDLASIRALNEAAENLKKREKFLEQLCLFRNISSSNHFKECFTVRPDTSLHGHLTLTISNVSPNFQFQSRLWSVTIKCNQSGTSHVFQFDEDLLPGSQESFTVPVPIPASSGVCSFEVCLSFSFSWEGVYYTKNLVLSTEVVDCLNLLTPGKKISCNDNDAISIYKNIDSNRPSVNSVVVKIDSGCLKQLLEGVELEKSSKALLLEGLSKSLQTDRESYGYLSDTKVSFCWMPAAHQLVLRATDSVVLKLMKESLYIRLLKLFSEDKVSLRCTMPSESAMNVFTLKTDLCSLNSENAIEDYFAIYLRLRNLTEEALCFTSC